VPDPQCVLHPDAAHPFRKIVKAGTYAVGEHPRQMFWCYPNGHRTDQARHRYGGLLARTILQPEDPAFCPDCSNDRQAHEGPIHGDGYDFATRAIAAALVAVGQGVSYNQAARNARAVSNRYRRNTQRQAVKGANGTMVADWIGVHGPVVTEPVTADVAWPRIVALDELPFRGSARRRKAAEQLGRAPNTVGWAVLAAYAYPGGDPAEPFPTRRSAAVATAATRKRGSLMALRPVSVANATEAAAFLLSFPGRPEYVICDGGKVWPLAVKLAWPDVWDSTTGELLEPATEVLPCTWHLGRDLRNWIKITLVSDQPDAALVTPAPAPGTTNIGLVNKTTHPAAPKSPTPGRSRITDDHELVRAARDAMKSLADWDAFYALAQQWSAEELLARLGDGSDVRHVLATWPAGVSRSVGGLEAAIRQLKANLSSRAGILSNEGRTQQLLNLMLMSARGLADERAYNRALHDALLPAGGRATPQKVGVTGGPRLQGVPTQRNASQQTRQATRTRYPRRISARRTSSNIGLAAQPAADREDLPALT